MTQCQLIAMHVQYAHAVFVPKSKIQILWCFITFSLYSAIYIPFLYIDRRKIEDAIYVTHWIFHQTTVGVVRERS